MICPLCQLQKSKPFTTLTIKPWPLRHYFQCQECSLIYLDPADRISKQDEKSVYDRHENIPTDPRYRKFLNRLLTPMLTKLRPGMIGLDYGSGPGPTSHVIMAEAGYPMKIYDPIYEPTPQVLKQKYDFITCSEVAEHFFNPFEEFKFFASILKPNGWLGIMTEYFENQDFKNWRYVRDPTHICLYSQLTMEWISHRHRWKLEIPRKNVALFHSDAKFL